MVLIWGYSESGKGVSRLCQKLNKPFICFDDYCKIPNSVPSCGRYSIPYHALEVVVVSPGISGKNELFERFADRHIPVISEPEFASRYAEGDILAVTGTNGKSTTVSMLYEILKADGRRVQLCGNIGRSFSDAVAVGAEVYVVEMSSFQLERISRFHPLVAGFLNLSPDHLSRHGNMETYINAKLRLFRQMTIRDTVVLSDTLPAELDVGLGRRVIFTTTGRAGWHCQSDSLCRGRTHIIKLSELSVWGRHNYENALCASAMASSYGVNDKSIASGLKAFKGLPHRVQLVDEVRGVKCIDDSKATNVQSARVGIESVDGRKVVLLGGSDKGEDYTLLFGNLQAVKWYVLYGATAEKLAQACEVCGVKNYQVVSKFADAMRVGYDHCERGDTLLLSPACASFDQFKNFEQRGDCFAEMVKGFKIEFVQKELLDDERNGVIHIGG